MKTDYGAAGIPMLPNVKGQKVTRNQIFGYSFPMAATAMLPFALAETGWVYGLAAIVLNIVFLALAFRVWRNDATDAAAMKPEKQLFAFSILYLFLLFALFALDRMLIL
jgi:protoheme IX farnesyltransferase